MSKLTNVLVASALLLTASAAFASSIAGHYDVTTNITPLGPQKFEFKYTVHNIDQQAPNDTYTGLDGFSVEVPTSAVISNITSPAPYHGSPGFWQAPTSLTNFLWWGMDPASVYPAGTDAVFSFVADNVAVGQTNAKAYTYWAFYYPGPETNPQNFNPAVETWYSQFEANIPGPVAVPLPSGLAAGLALGGLILGNTLRRRHA